MSRSTSTLVIWIFSWTLSAQSNVTPISYTTPGAVYTQSFDGLPSSGTYSLAGKGPFNLISPPIIGTNLNGWQFMLIGGTNNTASFGISTGSSTGNGVYSLGSASNSERALGSLASSTGISAFGVIFTNNTGITLNNIVISFTAEQWRKGGSGNKNYWVGKVKTGNLLNIDQPSLQLDSNLNFNSQVFTIGGTSLNGNLPENQQVINCTISNLIWKVGEQLLIRWDDLDETGNDDVCGIDNFRLSANLSSISPTVVANKTVETIARKATLFGSVNDNNAITSVNYEVDTSVTFSHPTTIKPEPDTIQAFTGITNTVGIVNGLSPNSKYFFRIKATNKNGTTTSTPISFITTIELPTVQTSSSFTITSNSAILRGNVTESGGSEVIEKGIVWSIHRNPSLTDYVISVGNGVGIFEQTITKLPSGTKIYFRTYAKNSGGVGWGNIDSFLTKAKILSITPEYALATNKSEASFILKSENDILGLTAENFSIVNNGISDAYIAGISKKGTNYLITINTGKGDGTLSLRMINDRGQIPAVDNIPFNSNGEIIVDKTPPTIRKLYYENKSYKLGDSIIMYTDISPDKDSIQLLNGMLNNIPIYGWNKINDSTYTSFCKIENNITDFPAENNTQVTIAISDLSGNENKTKEFIIVQDKDLIDSHQPYIKNIIVPNYKTYKTGDTLDFIFKFNETIRAVKNFSECSYSITIGTKLKKCICINSKESDSLVFRYIVQNGDLDKDGIKLTNTITLNDVLFEDIAGNIAMLNFVLPQTKGILIDAVPPAITKVATPASGIYRTGNVLDFIVNISKRIVFDDTFSLPSLQIIIGNKKRIAEYISGNGGNTILFRYKITDEDYDKDGIKLSEKITMNGNTIKDETGNEFNPTLTNIGALSGIKINPVTATINELIIPSSKVFGYGDEFDLIVKYSEIVLVDTNKGLPYIKLTIGNTSREAIYQTGSGSNELIFNYVISKTDYDTNGIVINNSITLNKSVITDANYNTAPISINALYETRGKIIDGISPKVINLDPPPNKIYKIGDTIIYKVNFSEPVYLADQPTNPSIDLVIGKKINEMYYVSGSGSKNFIFNHIVEEGEMDMDGIKYGSQIELHSSTIKDLAGNDLINSFTGSISKNVLIDAIKPTLTSIIYPTKGIYKTGSLISFTLIFSESIVFDPLNQDPSLQLKIGTKKQNLMVTKGIRSNELLFQYQIQESDIEKKGIQLVFPEHLEDRFFDIAGNNAFVNELSDSIITGVLVNPVTIKSENTIPISGRYKIGDSIICKINFNEPIVITKGNPFIKFWASSKEKKLVYLKGSGSELLTFYYIVIAGDKTQNGILIDTLINIDKSVITDTSGFNAPLVLKDIGVFTEISIDGIGPTFISSKDEKVVSCLTGGEISLQNYLIVQDEDVGENLNWKITSTHHIGECDSSSFHTISSNKPSVPINIHFIPKIDKTGIDTILISVNDGINYIQKRVIIEIQPLISNNYIGNDQIFCVNSSPEKILGMIPEGGSGNYSYSWESATKDSTQFTLAPGKNNEASYQPSSTTIIVWYRRKVISGACVDLSIPVRITPIKYGYWTGNIDSNWNEPKNWCSLFIPDKYTDAIIKVFNTHHPIILDSAQCNNLILLNQSKINIAGFLDVFGSLQSENENINAKNGTIRFSGTTLQTASGNQLKDHTLKNLILNNSSRLIVQDSVLVTGSLKLEKGIVISDDHLYLSSDTRIQPSSIGTSIIGNVHVSPILNGGRRVFHLLGNPFTKDIGLNMISNQIDISGEGGTLNGFTTTQTNQPSAFRYDPISGNDSTEVEAGWSPFTNVYGRDENVWKKNLGIRLLMRGKPGQGLNGTPVGNGQNGTYYPETVFLHMSGPVAVGDQEIILQNGNTSGYHVVGNPFISNIDLSRITKGKNIGNYFWIWDPQQGLHGGYTSLPFNNPYFLPSFGAFITRSNSNIENGLVFTENCKTDQSASINFTKFIPDDLYYLEFNLSSDSIKWDRLLILSKDTARSSYDKNDAEKFLNPDVNLYSISKDNRKLSIDSRPINNQSTIPIGIDVDQDQQFQLRITGMNFPALNTLQLHDKFLNIWFPLAKDSIYSFFTTTDTLSKGINRFELSTKKLRSDTLRANNGINAEVKPIPAKDHVIVHFKSVENGNTQIRILTVSGIPVKIFTYGILKEAELSIPLNGLPDKIYLLEIRCGDQMITKKLLME